MFVHAICKNESRDVKHVSAVATRSIVKTNEPQRSSRESEGNNTLSRHIPRAQCINYVSRTIRGWQRRQPARRFAFYNGFPPGRLSLHYGNIERPGLIVKITPLPPLCSPGIQKKKKRKKNLVALILFEFQSGVT